MSKHPLTYKPKASKVEETSKQRTLDVVVKPRYCAEGKSKEITDKILMMIALDLRAVRIVEGRGCKTLMNYVEPGYTVPSRKHISTLLKHKHSLFMGKLKENLDKETLVKETESIVLTTDIWISATTEAYITVTVHYFDMYLKIQSFVLQTSAFPERHTGIDIATKLKEICDNFRFSEKVSFIVHDQTANMICSLDILEFERQWKSLSCTAHSAIYKIWI